jgi:hypothetical protein
MLIIACLFVFALALGITVFARSPYPLLAGIVGLLYDTSTVWYGTADNLTATSIRLTVVAIIGALAALTYLEYQARKDRLAQVKAYR